MPNLTVAKKTLARIEESIAMGTWRKLRKELCGCERAELKIAELIEIYLSDYCKTHNSNLEFKQHAVKPIRRILGQIRLSDFRRSHAHDFIAVRSGEVTPATVNSGLAVLKNMLSFAVDKEYLEAHPLWRFKLLREERQALRIMTLEEYRSLVEAVACVEHTIGAYTAVLGETALRKSEGLRLKWSDVDLAQRRITVAKSKNGLPRYVPLSEYAIKWLASLPRAISCAYVFVQLEKMTGWKDPRGPFDQGKKAAGLGWVRGFHDLRHFRATQCLANGVDIRTVSELLGHSDLTTTMRYVHYLQEHATKSVRQAEERELATVGGRKVDGVVRD